MPLCDKNYYLANVTRKEVIQLVHPDDNQKTELWKFLIKYKDIKWQFIDTPTSKKDHIKFFCTDQTRKQLVAKGYTDYTHIAKSLFQYEDEDEDEDDIDEFYVDENNDLALKIKRKSPEQLKRLTVRDLRAYAKDLRLEARLMMCPKVVYSKLRKDDLIELILVCKKLGGLEQEEKEKKRLASLQKKQVLAIVQDMAAKTKNAHVCVEKAYSLRKADLVEAILTCQEIV